MVVVVMVVWPFLSSISPAGHFAASLVIGTAIGQRLDGFIDDFQLRPVLAKGTSKIKVVEWSDSKTTTGLIVFGTVLYFLAPVGRLFSSVTYRQQQLQQLQPPCLLACMHARTLRVHALARRIAS